ncbi:MAG: response regulator transcription factor [Anaerobutyricum sp.]|nr:response regulator transcription factor [Anaerobutyricum sp.]
MLIQIVEDDRALSDGVKLALQEPEMAFSQSGNVRQAKEAFERQLPDLIILDINLPDGSGYDYLKWVRERSSLPVLILTANDMEMDEVTGLTLGADDYMTKPFRLAVLRARIQVLRRRIEKTEAVKQHQEIYREDGFRFHFDTMKYFRDNQEIFLSVNEQKLLRLLVLNKGNLLTRNYLMDRLWSDSGEYVDENALSVTVNRLRSKLERKKEGATYIQTIYGQGYMWKKQEK